MLRSPESSLGPGKFHGSARVPFSSSATGPRSRAESRGAGSGVVLAAIQVPRRRTRGWIPSYYACLLRATKGFSTASSVSCESLCRPDRRDQAWTGSRPRRGCGLLESSPALVKDAGDSLIVPLRDQPPVGSCFPEPWPANMLVNLAALRDPKAPGRMRAASLWRTWYHVSDAA